MASHLVSLLLATTIVLGLTVSTWGQAHIPSIEKDILDRILGSGKYDTRIRPSGNRTGEGEGPVMVKSNMYVRSISRIDDVNMDYSVQLTFRQQWKDDRLKYDDVSGKVKYLTLTDPSRVWRPDVFFSNEKSGHFHDIVMPNTLMRIFPDGQVLYSVRISLVLSCPMNLEDFPFDQQTCSIIMASYGYTTDDLVLVWKEEDPVQITKNLHLPHFTLKSFVTGNCTSRTNTGEYSCLKVDMTLKRDMSYYLVQVYIPCCMLVLVSFVQFWFDRKATVARIVLALGTLLALAILISDVNRTLPPTSYTKAIDVYTGICLTFAYFALLEFATVHYILQGADGEKSDRLRHVDGLNNQENGNDANGTNTSDSKMRSLYLGFRTNSSLPRRLDIISRIAFPVAFAIFLSLYWLINCVF